MKKILVFTMVMVLACASVFSATTEAKKAEGSAYINVIYELLEVAPRFELATTSGVKTNGTDAVASDTTPSEVTLDGDLTTANATVGFAINQIATARTNSDYTLTVTATDMTLTAYADGTAKSGALLDNEKFSVSSATPTVTVSSASIKGDVLTSVEMAAVTAANNVLSIDYKGVVSASSSSKKTLGTFNVEYAKNADAVPGSYKSTVTLSVTAV